MQENTHAVPYEVTYCSNTETLIPETIEKIENQFTNNNFNAIIRT